MKFFLPSWKNVKLWGNSQLQLSNEFGEYMQEILIYINIVTHPARLRIGVSKI